MPHAFKVESESARALVVVTPGGFERMFEEGGTRWAQFVAAAPALPPDLAEWLRDRAGSHQPSARG